MLLLEIMT